MLFWIIAGLMLLAGLLIVLLPLLRGGGESDVSRATLNLAIYRSRLDELESDRAEGLLDQDRFEQAKIDLQRELLRDSQADSDRDGRSVVTASPATAPVVAVMLTLALPALAFGLYAYQGRWDDLAEFRAAMGQAEAAAASSAANAEGATDPNAAPTFEEMLTHLEQRLAAEPENRDGWRLLGRSYLSVGRFEEAASAFQHLVTLTERDSEADSEAFANALIDYAEARVLAAEEQVDEQTSTLLARALMLTPDHPKALWYSGLGRFQQQRFREALEQWYALEQMVDMESRQALAPWIDDAEQQLIAQGGAPPSVAPATSAGPVSAATIRVAVTLAPALAEQVGPDDTLFVFARAAQGPPMPLAIARLPATALPASVSLSDSMAMMPEMKLSSFEEVVVGARISRSGQAMPQPGDLQGLSEAISSAYDGELELMIDSVVP